MGPKVDGEIRFPAQLALTHWAQELLPPVLVGGGVILLNQIFLDPQSATYRLS